MWTDRLLKADINISTATTTEVIAAPGAGKFLAIDFIAAQTDAANDVTIKDGSTTYGGAYNLTAGGGLTFENTIKNKDGIITLTANTALNITTSAATQLSGFVRYRVVNL